MPGLSCAGQVGSSGSGTEPLYPTLAGGLPYPWAGQGSTRIDELGNLYTVFTGYTSFIVITKYWLYSLCCIIQPCRLSYTQYFLPPVSVHMGPGL